MRDDFAVADEDADRVVQLFDAVSDIFEFGGLPDGDVMLARESFDGWFGHLAAATPWRVGLGDDSGHRKISVI